MLADCADPLPDGTSRVGDDHQETPVAGGDVRTDAPPLVLFRPGEHADRPGYAPVGVGQRGPRRLGGLRDEVEADAPMVLVMPSRTGPQASFLPGSIQNIPSGMLRSSRCVKVSENRCGKAGAPLRARPSDLDHEDPLRDRVDLDVVGEVPHRLEHSPFPPGVARVLL